MSGGMTKSAIELGEHDIDYKPRVSIGQTLADFRKEILEDQAQTVTHVNEAQLLSPSQTPITDKESK